MKFSSEMEIKGCRGRSGARLERLKQQMRPSPAPLNIKQQSKQKPARNEQYPGMLAQATRESNTLAIPRRNRRLIAREKARRLMRQKRGITERVGPRGWNRLALA